MFRIAKMSGRWLAYDIGELITRMEVANIEEFVNEGTPVLIADDLKTAADALEIGLDEIRLVEPE